MDPDAALDLMTSAHRTDDHEEAADAATDLLRWLDRGGFPPQDMTAPEARALAHSIRADAKDAMQPRRRRRYASR